jgi:hypothetical protein
MATKKAKRPMSEAHRQAIRDGIAARKARMANEDQTRYESKSSDEHAHGEYRHAHGGGGEPHSHEVESVKPDSVKDQEHEAALAAAAQADAEAREAFPTVSDPDPDRIYHVLHDGFTVLGKVHYYGEEILIREGSKRWNDLALDSEGNCIFDQTEAQQIERYGAVMFREGPFPKKAGEATITDEEYLQAVSSGDPEALRRYEKRVQRGEVAPPMAPTRAGV